MKAFHEVRNYKSDFKVWYSSYSNISFVAHWHKEIEMIYIKSGSAQINVTNFSFTAAAGDLVICDSGDIHYSDRCSKNNALDFIIFDTSILNNFYQYNYFNYPHITKEQLESHNLTEPLEQLITTLKGELEQREDYYQDIVTASIRKFWYYLKRKLPAGNIKSESRRLMMLNEFQQVLSYMEKHCSDNITLEDASERMNFSPSHFSKIFKQLTGTNFVKYLNIVRISQAAEQLKNSPDKITNIAFDCGFNNIRTFNRVFKEITGYTPSDFMALPERTSYNFTYYKSNSSIPAYLDADPLTIIPLLSN